jgi:hypothetical protein
MIHILGADTVQDFQFRCGKRCGKFEVAPTAAADNVRIGSQCIFPYPPPPLRREGVGSVWDT